MPLTMQCLQCSLPLNIPDQAMGHRLQCRYCGVFFALPKINAQSAHLVTLPGPGTTFAGAPPGAPGSRSTMVVSRTGMYPAVASGQHQALPPIHTPIQTSPYGNGQVSRTAGGTAKFPAVQIKSGYFAAANELREPHRDVEETRPTGSFPAVQGRRTGMYPAAVTPPSMSATGRASGMLPAVRSGNTGQFPRVNGGTGQFPRVNGSRTGQFSATRGRTGQFRSIGATKRLAPISYTRLLAPVVAPRSGEMRVLPRPGQATFNLLDMSLYAAGLAGVIFAFVFLFAPKDPRPVANANAIQQLHNYGPDDRPIERGVSAPGASTIILPPDLPAPVIVEPTPEAVPAEAKPKASISTAAAVAQTSNVVHISPMASGQGDAAALALDAYKARQFERASRLFEQASQEAEKSGKANEAQDWTLKAMECRRMADDERSKR